MLEWTKNLLGRKKMPAKASAKEVQPTIDELCGKIIDATPEEEL